jgi:hypothetical protein
VSIEREIGPEFLEEFSRASVKLTGGRELSLLELMSGWERHVERLIAQSHSHPIRASVVWGADDFVAALHLRSFVAQAQKRLEPEAHFKLDSWLAEVDGKFRSFTQSDRRHLLTMWMNEAPSDEWWWKRVPKEGAILKELESARKS